MITKLRVCQIFIPFSTKKSSNITSSMKSLQGKNNGLCSLKVFKTEYILKAEGSLRELKERTGNVELSERTLPRSSLMNRFSNRWKQIGHTYQLQHHKALRDLSLGPKVYYLKTVRPWINYFSSLHVSFLILKKGDKNNNYFIGLSGGLSKNKNQSDLVQCLSQ